MKKYLRILAAALFAQLSVNAQSGSSLLWRIDSKSGEEPSYLFGTIHVPQKKYVNYSDSVYMAIQNTEVLYTEIDFLKGPIFDDSTLRFLTEKGKQIDSIQKTAGWKRLINNINRKYNVNLNADSAEQFLEFSQRMMSEYFEPDEGIQVPDMMLANHAEMLRKETGGLETYLLQMSMIYEVLFARLEDTTMDLNEEAALIANMKRYYLHEHLDSITQLVEGLNLLYRQIVFDRRNKTMVDSIIKHIGNQPSFFAVGVGHLGGQYGIINLLRGKGFKLSPVISSNKISMVIVNNMLKMQKTELLKAMDEDDDMEDMKIDIIEPPPPPPKVTPKKVTIKPAPVKKKKD